MFPWCQGWATHQCSSGCVFAILCPCEVSTVVARQHDAEEAPRLRLGARLGAAASGKAAYRCGRPGRGCAPRGRRGQRRRARCPRSPAPASSWRTRRPAAAAACGAVGPTGREPHADGGNAAGHCEVVSKPTVATVDSVGEAKGDGRQPEVPLGNSRAGARLRAPRRPRRRRSAHRAQHLAVANRCPACRRPPERLCARAIVRLSCADRCAAVGRVPGRSDSNAGNRSFCGNWE